MEANVIYCGDNLEVLPKHVRKESVDLIYIDPPFNTSRNYEVFWGEAQERRAFEDRFGDAMTYLEWAPEAACAVRRPEADRQLLLPLRLARFALCEG